MFDKHLLGRGSLQLRLLGQKLPCHKVYGTLLSSALWHTCGIRLGLALMPVRPLTLCGFTQQTYLILLSCPACQEGMLTLSLKDVSGEDSPAVSVATVPGTCPVPWAPQQGKAEKLGSGLQLLALRLQDTHALPVSVALPPVRLGKVPGW